MLPLVPPIQEGLTCVSVIINAFAGWAIDTVKVSVQNTASVTTTVYVPAGRLLMS